MFDIASVLPKDRPPVDGVLSQLLFNQHSFDVFEENPATVGYMIADQFFDGGLIARGHGYEHLLMVFDLDLGHFRNFQEDSAIARETVTQEIDQGADEIIVFYYRHQEKTDND